MKKEKVIPAIGVVILAGLLILTLASVKTNFTLKDDLKKEKLNSEQLLASKLQLSKEIEKNKQDMESIKAQISEVNKKNENLSAQMTEKDRRINILSKENQSLKNVKNELAEAQNQKKILENQFADLQLNYEKLRNNLADKEKLISTLDKQLMDLNRIMNQVSISPDNYQVSATKGKKKERLTIVASRTRKLTIDFEIPTSNTGNISFAIITPSGKRITSSDKALSWSVYNDPGNLTASLSAISGEFEESEQVKLTYSSKEKLQPGIYNIEVLGDGNVLGRCRVKLK